MAGCFRRSAGPRPAHSGTHVRKWLKLSHQATESYRSRLFPVTSMRNAPMISVNAPHGAGSLPIRPASLTATTRPRERRSINQRIDHQTDGKGLVLEPLNPGNEHRDRELRDGEAEHNRRNPEGTPPALHGRIVPDRVPLQGPGGTSGPARQAGGPNCHSVECPDSGKSVPLLGAATGGVGVLRHGRSARRVGHHRCSTRGLSSCSGEVSFAR